jgi:membrane protease YdiL (CAAX protease family)
MSHKIASASVGHILFGGGVFFTTILFQFLNPIFEELIVRAYLMTEIKALTGSASKAILASTLLQMSYHFYQGAPVAFAHGATFLLWSIYYAKTNRIAPIILAHLYSDVSGTLWYMFRH